VIRLYARYTGVQPAAGDTWQSKDDLFRMVYVHEVTDRYVVHQDHNDNAYGAHPISHFTEEFERATI
jgi:hypothetical protein